MTYTEVKDSGQREDFTTGSVRDTREGKGRYDLISPIFNERLAKHLELGAAKYAERNWEKGQEVSRCMDSCKRHLNKYLEGHRDEDHLAAASTNLMFIIHTEEMVRRGRLPVSLIDWPNYLVDDTKLRESEESFYEELDKVAPTKPHPNLPDLPFGWGYTGSFRVAEAGETILTATDSTGFRVDKYNRLTENFDLYQQFPVTLGSCESTQPISYPRWILERTDD